MAATGHASAQSPELVSSEEATRLRVILKREAAGKPGSDGVAFWLDAESEIQRAQQGAFLTWKQRVPLRLSSVLSTEDNWLSCSYRPMVIRPFD